MAALNDALLAKQAWKILQEPSSFFASFFPSKYSEEVNFLEVEHKPGASWAWRRILVGMGWQ